MTRNASENGSDDVNENKTNSLKRKQNENSSPSDFDMFALVYNFLQSNGYKDAAEKMTPMMLQECFMALARLALGDTPAAADRRARIRALHGIPLVVDAIAAHYTPETFKWGLDCCLHVAHGEDEYKMQWERCLAQHPDLQERAMRDAMRARGAEGTAAGTPLPAQLAELLSGFVK